MKQMTKAMLLAGGLALLAASASYAQAPDEPARFFVSVSGGFQSASRTSTDSGTFVLYDETGSFTGTRKVDSGAFFDIGGGMHVTGSLSAGVSVSRFVKSSNVPFTVVAPHPEFYDRPRTATLNVNDLGHTETGIHLSGIWQLFSQRKYDASVFAGPSIFSVKEDSVTAVAVSEQGAPFTTLNMTATFASASKTAVGGHVGLDVNYHVTGGLGAGLFVRYAYASAKLTPSGGAERTVKVGGPQVGIGVRYRF